MSFSKKTISLVICIIIPLLVGSIAGIATAKGVGSWYLTIRKPSFNPPNYLFAPVWTSLYLLMGISLYMIWSAPINVERTKAIKIFAVQLLLNFLWSFIFFYFQNITVALVEIMALWIAIIAMIVQFKKVSVLAAYLNIPYLLWVSFATVLNAAIWHLN